MNRESAQALREYADIFPQALANITEATLKLISVYQSVSDTLGSHRNDFYGLLLHIRNAQALSVEALNTLPPMMRNSADKIDRYLALQGSAGGAAGASWQRGESPDSAGGMSQSSSPKTLGGRELLEAFGTVQVRNGTDVFVKGEHFDLFEQAYYSAEENPYHPYNDCIEQNISPALIEGIHLGKSEAENPGAFWQCKENGGTAESFQQVARCIPEVRRRLASGATLSEIESDPQLSACVGIYFRNMPQVIKCDGYYEFTGNGRHRILAARALGYTIPVKVIGERTRKS